MKLWLSTPEEKLLVVTGVIVPAFVLMFTVPVNEVTVLPKKSFAVIVLENAVPAV